MPTVKQRTARKIGLFSAISLLIGSIIGIGIFFKNGNIFTTNDNNAIGILVAWILSGIISLCAAFSFAEVGSSINSNAGVGGWCGRLISKGFGRFVKIVQPTFYFTALSFSISIFASEAIFNIFNISNQVHFSVILIVGLILFTFFLFFNFISLRVSAKFQSIFTLLKFVPLLMVIISGVVYGINNPDGSLLSPTEIEKSATSFNFGSVLICIPSILFAFDPFFGVGNLSKDMTNPKRNVPLTIIISMIIVTIFYILVTVGQIMVGSGVVYDMFDIIFGENQTIKVIISVFIFIAIIGVLNSFCALIIRSYQSILDERLVAHVFKIQTIANSILPNYKNSYKAATLITFISYLAIFTILFIPSTILNTDAFVDGLSNFPVIFFFGVYGTVILGGIINRYTKKVQVLNIKGFLFFAPIAVIGCFLVSFSQFFYTFTVLSFMNPEGTLAWGLFSVNGFVTYNWMGSIFLFSYLFAMLSYYLFHHLKTKKYIRSSEIIAEVTYY